MFNRILLFWLRIEADYSTELLMAMLCDNISLVANPPSIAVKPVNEQFWLMLIKVTEFCAPPFSKL